MNSTLKYYEENASELSSRYETAQLDHLYLDCSNHFASGSRLLEIGCGSGRDAAHLSLLGYQVRGIDGSSELIKKALEHHPELDGKLSQLVLPAELPFADQEFDGFYSIACFMHFSISDLNKILAEIVRILNPEGRGLVSVPARRPDVSVDGVDRHGRVFNVLPSERWLEIFKAAGFKGKAGPEQPDGAGREGITWVNFFLEL
ncbi:MAG: class I SAM-dependent methyltransferase [Candidatus Rifleibacteriota bacterium]